jgi:cyclophilin family peptidyl-prolyl cis-trans isomerase
MMKKHLFSLFVSLVFILLSTGLNAQDHKAQLEQLIKIETTLGDMVIKLYNETPLHRDNMIELIEGGFYKDQLFHRVIKGFMIQGGDPHSVGAEKGQRLGAGNPGYTIPAEFNENLIHKKGALAAARQGDQLNPEKASSGSQFYIVQGRPISTEELNIMLQRELIKTNKEMVPIYTTLGGTPHLDGSYTVFGEVLIGLEVLDSIAASETDSYDRPLDDVAYTISLIR